jgi:hypothetical protein
VDWSVEETRAYPMSWPCEPVPAFRGVVFGAALILAVLALRASFVDMVTSVWFLFTMGLKSLQMAFTNALFNP